MNVIRLVPPPLIRWLYRRSLSRRLYTMYGYHQPLSKYEFYLVIRQIRPEEIREKPRLLRARYLFFADRWECKNRPSAREKLTEIVIETTFL